MENHLGGKHRKCTLQKRNVTRELKKIKIYHVCPQQGKKIYIHVHEITQIDNQMYQCLECEQSFCEN